MVGGASGGQPAQYNETAARMRISVYVARELKSASTIASGSALPRTAWYDGAAHY